MGDDQLHGGAISRGIVRAGEVVRRPAGTWSPAVHAHLGRLLEEGFLVPTPLGLDGGVELLGYIEGSPLWTPGQRSYVTDTEVGELGALLRSYHDTAARVGVLETGVWNRLPVEPASTPDIICHNDFAPWNVLRTRDGLALIDWDLAAPGNRLWDLSYAAWVTVPMWNEADVAVRGLDPVPNRSERLAVFLDAYGATTQERGALLDVIERRLEAAIEQARAWSDEGRPGWRQQWSLPEPYRHGGGDRRDLAFIAAQRSEWMAVMASA